MNYALVVNLIINSSIISALLIILLLLAKWIFNKKISAKWHYIIWFTLLLRLAVPYMAYSPLNFSNLNTEAMTGSSSSVDAGIQASQNNPSVITQASCTIGNTFHKLINCIVSFHFDYTTAFEIWILGVLILSLYSFIYNILFWIRVRNGTIFTEPSILKLLEESKEQLGIQTSISIIQTSGISIPAIFGVTRPWLLIPETVLKSMGHENLRFVILHELAHLRRKDIIINWIALVLQIIHWFNPLVWLAFRKMRADREMACDEAVLMHLEQKEAMQYGHTLLDMVEIFSGRVRYAGIAGILEEKSQIKTRIQRISQFDRRHTKLPALAIILVVLMGSSIAVNANNLSSPSEPQTSADIHLIESAKSDARDIEATIKNTPDSKMNEEIEQSNSKKNPIVKPAVNPKAQSDLKPDANTGSKTGTKASISNEGAAEKPLESSEIQISPQQNDTAADFAEPFEEDAVQSTADNSDDSLEEGVIDISTNTQQ